MTKPRVRILHLPFFYFPEAWNGIDEHLLLLARHIDRARFEFLLMSHPHDGTQTTTLAERAAMPMLNAPCGSDTNPSHRLRALTEIFREQHIDVLHLHSPVVGGQFIPALAARMAGVPAVIASYHQFQSDPLPPLSRVISRVTHSTLIDHTVAISPALRDSLIHKSAVPPSRIRLILYGTDAPDETLQREGAPPRLPGELRLGYFGRLSEEKGIPTLLEALSILAKRHPEVRTILAGDGPERARLERMAVDLGIADKVYFLGFRRDARLLMEEVDIVVHVPIVEGFGLVVLEAAAAGRPVVVNQAPGGISEIVVDRETGLVVPSGSPRGVVDAIEYLAARPAERIRLGHNGYRRWSELFSARQMARHTMELYERSLPRRLWLT
jgi:glycosyltransferase involved in cell wall biosynthesis